MCMYGQESEIEIIERDSFVMQYKEACFKWGKTGNVSKYVSSAL